MNYVVRKVTTNDLKEYVVFEAGGGIEIPVWNSQDARAAYQWAGVLNALADRIRA